jgi:hypothetical protein
MALKNNLQILNPTTYSNWDDILLSTSGASFFHTAAWATVLTESYSYTPCYFAAIDNDRLTALCSLMDVRSALTGCRGVSLPFTDYCEPIAHTTESFQDMFTCITRYGRERGWKHIELRGGEALLKDIPHSSFYYGHTLKLHQNPETLFSTFRDSTKRNIKKAGKENVEIKIIQDIEGMKTFYGLNCMTRQQHGLPPQPMSFFKKVHEHILSKGRGFIVLAMHEGKPVAGNIFFHFGKKALYKYGASDKNYQHLRANNLVMWEAIRWYCKNGYTHFCFGRTEPENDGLRQFKNGWGTREHDIRYYKYDLQRNEFIGKSGRIGHRYKKVFARMPIPALKLTGNLLYRHMG